MIDKCPPLSELSHFRFMSSTYYYFPLHLLE